MSESRHPERIIPEETVSGPLAAHLIRYQFALEHCRDRRVLDAACGVGYGSEILGRVAAEVIGIDVAPEAVEYASRNYASGNVHFEIMDVQEMRFPDDSFDAVCSFETVEHVPDPEHFIEQVARVLRPGGTFLVSTPHVPSTNHAPANPYHHLEYSRVDFERLLRSQFAEVIILGQSRRQSGLHRFLQRMDFLGIRRMVPRLLRTKLSNATGTTSWEDSEVGDFLIGPDLKRASEIVALCRA